MTKRNTPGYRLTLIASLACLPGISQAATAVSDNFDADLGSWVNNTPQSINTHVPTGGNPDGYLFTENRTSFTMGAVNLTPDYTGIFADGIWNIKVDLNFINGNFTDSRLRFRYQDLTTNGWHISLEKTNFFDLPEWKTYSVTFDTTWDDATAMANGWRKEADGSTPTPHFKDLWDNVYTSEVRITADPGSVAGIDNYIASPVPVPAAVWLFGSGLLGLAGIARRRKPT